MELLPTILSVLTFLVLIFSILKPKIGAMLYLIYMYMAPYLYLNGFIIYSRTTAVLFFILFLFKFRNKLSAFDYKPFMPYIILLSLNFLLLFTSEKFIVSMNSWFTSVSSLFFILFLYGNIKTYPQTIKLYSNTLFYIFSFITIYGLLLTLTPGINPYQMIIQPLFGLEFNEAYAAGNSGLAAQTELAEGRLFGRISSVFIHPMTYGLNLGFFFIYSLYFLRNKPKILITVLSCIFLAIFTSGIRTPIAALAITCLIMILYIRKFKIFIYGICIFIIIIFVLPMIYPEANNYIMSIIDSNHSNIQGSSLSMRIEQLDGCFDIIKNNILTGKGYGWASWYNATYGTHPKLLWFESLIYIILVNNGIIGFFIWGYFIWKYYKYTINNFNNIFTRSIILGLLVYYLIYCTITGDFGINYMFIFYTIIIGLEQNKTRYCYQHN